MGRYLAIDFETANGYRDSACELGIALVEDQQVVHSAAYLIRPSIYYDTSEADDFDFKFTHVHGISWENVAYEPDFGELWGGISHYFDELDFIAAHNAAFDLGVLRACCDSFYVEYTPPISVCTMKLARRVWRIYPTGLENVCKELGIDLNHHAAEADALACASIVIKAEQAGYSLQI